MNTFQATILIIVLATLSACESEPPERPSKLAEILQADGTTAVKWDQFKTLAEYHRKLLKPEWSREASTLLINIKDYDDKLADALLMHKERNLDEEYFESAFVQYLTATGRDILTDDYHPDAEQWAKRHARRVTVTFESEYLPENNWKSLQEKLRLINYARYGSYEVIPAPLFQFTDDELYTKENAMWMAEMAALAYHKEVAVRGQLVRWEYKVDSPSFRWINDVDSGTQGFVVRNESHVILSFRGTEKKFTDILTDLRIKREALPTGGEVHSGFRNALDAVWKEVDAAVEMRGSRKLFITGHSLGAALAQLAAHRLEDNHAGTVTAVYAFGSPFIGNDDFAKAYDSVLARRTFPHVNHKDAVTTIPPRRLGFKRLATASTWRFTGTGHTMAKLEAHAGEEDIEYTVDELFDEANKDLQTANRYIARGANEIMAALTTELPPDFDMGYGGHSSTESGRLDEHGINQYLFKLGCAVLEEMWEEVKNDAVEGATG